MEAPAAAVVPSVEVTPQKHETSDHDTKPALTPPTSEDMGKQDDPMSSELSELDSDDDDEEIEPDHYFEGGKIPVFKPTMDQFRNFRKFIDKIDKYGMKSGIVKVVPPKEWRDSLPDLSEQVKTIKVKNPIMQEFAGQHGIYTQANIEKQRSYNLPEWRALTEESHHQPPARRGERRKAAAEPPARTRSTRAQPAAANSDDTPKRGPGRPRRRQAKAEPKDEENDDAVDIEVPPTPKSPGAEEDEKPGKQKKSTRTRGKKDDQETPTKARGRQPKSTSSRRMNNRAERNDYVDEAAFEGFDYHLPDVDKDFTIERCKELEDVYWKTINYGQPMYGADMPGSLFDDRTTSWNVAKLPNLLDVLGTKVPGVNTAYLYLGMWKATFAWHLEDVDLYSINYIHFGAPKQWYSISQEDARRFEAAMKNIWPRDSKNCSQFLRHKTYLISPAQLEKQYNIKVNRLVHYEGEFVITYPYGYHSGYNLGYNCAESVNFANESWLSYGRIAKKCECESDSVWVDVNEIERKLRGEPTPEYYEETDDEEEEDVAEHLPSPPSSVVGKGKARGGRKPANKRKRANEELKEAPKPKKMKRIRIRIKVPGKGMPCVLCPNDVDYDELLPTDTGLKAHRMCADYTPETYISAQNVVCNVGNIGKDRLDLKCNYCRSKRGAVFQCSQKKCTRAFHATCAAPAGVQVDLGPMPTFDEEGTEYFYDGYDFRCRFHRPKKRNLKKVTSDTLENDKFIMNYAKNLKPRDVVQFQYLDSEMYQIYGGLVIENRPSEGSLLVEVLPDGDRVEVEWKYLLALDPVDSERPKPSANAKPLPEHLKETDSSLAITNRTDGVPEMGDSFHDPNSEQKWAEFNTAPEVNAKVAKVDLSKVDQLWFYLGQTSTEARPQYTEDLAKPRHNVKSVFLDTVKPPPTPWPAYSSGRPYQGMHTMPLKPMPIPMSMSYQMPSKIAPQIQPNIKPYQYKPKPDPVPAPSQAFKYPPPDARKYANSMVGHQPNVVYDPRPLANKALQHGNQSQAQGQAPSGPYHHHRLAPQTQTFHHYAPPQSTNTTWKASPASGPMIKGIDRYASRSPPLPPNPYQYQPPSADNGQPHNPQFPYRQHAAPAPQAHPQAAPSSSGAPPPQSQQRTSSLAHLLAKPAGNAKPPMYANSPPTTFTPSRPSQSEYLAADGSFAPEWRPKNSPPGVTQATNGIAPRPPITAFRPSSQHQSSQPPPPAPSGPGHAPPTYHHYSGPPAAPAGAPHSLPPPPRQMPALNFMSETDFKRDMQMAKTAPPASVSHQMPMWDSMMRQINSGPTSAASTPAPSESTPGSGRGTPHLPPPLPAQHRASYTPQPQLSQQHAQSPHASMGYVMSPMPGHGQGLQQMYASGAGAPPRRESSHGAAPVGLPSGTPPIKEMKTHNTPVVSAAGGVVGPSPKMHATAPTSAPTPTPPPPPPQQQKAPEPWKFQYFSVPGNSAPPGPTLTTPKAKAGKTG